MDNNKSHIDELNREIQQNMEDYNNGSISYEELQEIQRDLINERNELL